MKQEIVNIQGSTRLLWYVKPWILMLHVFICGVIGELGTITSRLGLTNFWRTQTGQHNGNKNRLVTCSPLIKTHYQSCLIQKEGLKGSIIVTQNTLMYVFLLLMCLSSFHCFVYMLRTLLSLQRHSLQQELEILCPVIFSLVVKSHVLSLMVT